MRINVYAEELTDEVEIVRKYVDDEEYGPRTFYGIRVYLKSPDVLHHSEADDDRSAVTFFVPWTKEGGHDFPLVKEAFVNMMDSLHEAFMEVAQSKTETVAL